MKPKDRFLNDMRRDMPAMSALSHYLNWVRGQDAEAAQGLEADIMEAFSTDAGLRVLKLFEKSVLLVGQPSNSTDGALREMNAVRNFVLEIRRYVANG